CGAQAAPAEGTEAETETALLTRLSAFDICTGRFAAAMWTPLLFLAASCVFWLGAQFLFRVVSGDGIWPVITAHAIILSAMITIGAASQFSALWGSRGIAGLRAGAAGLILATISVFAIFLVNPVVLSMENPGRLL